jgi:hypothetical protein
MNNQGKILAVTGTFILLTSLACNALVGLGLETPTPGQGPDQAPDASPPPTEIPTSIPDPTVTPPPEAFCPQAGEGTTRYISRENGFCILYPDGFELRDDPQSPGSGIDLIGPLLDPDAFETIAVFMQIENTGPADGLDSAAYAERWQELYLPEMGRLPQSDLDLAGFDDVPELAEPANEVWETVTESIRFFRPENDRVVRRASELCPVPGEGELGLTAWVEGYCLLYPSEYFLDPDFPGRITGGPLIDDFEPWGEIYTSLTTGTFGYFDVETPIELLQERVDSIDPDSIEEVVIGGYPAVIFRNTAGPWASRQAMILVDGFIYTIVAQPAEPLRYPDGIPHLERIWDAVTGSLAFFDPWR